MTTISKPNEADLSRKSAIADQRLHEAAHKDDDKKQVPVEHHAAHLNAILLALEAMQNSRIVDEKGAQVESEAVNALTSQMSDLNAQLSSMNQYQTVSGNLSGDDLTNEIEKIQTANAMVDARRSFVEGEYGDDKLVVQQKQSTIGSDINAVVQQLQQAAGLMNDVSQLANVVSGR